MVSGDHYSHQRRPLENPIFPSTTSDAPYVKSEGNVPKDVDVLLFFQDVLNCVVVAGGGGTCMLFWVGGCYINGNLQQKRCASKSIFEFLYALFVMREETSKFVGLGSTCRCVQFLIWRTVHNFKQRFANGWNTSKVFANETHPLEFHFKICFSIVFKGGFLHIYN